MLSSSVKDITILADVVDNFGDIGVAWRLTRNIIHSSQSEAYNIRIVTNNLKAFHNINNQIDPNLSYQKCKCETKEIEVYDWTDYDFCYRTFTESPPEVILEMFQCGQPDWLEKILFEDRVSYKVHIIMIDYLSAEPWVDDFHCLKSLTRTALVPKVNFMPGFTQKTGGLLLNTLFPVHKEKCINSHNNNCQLSQVLFFAYNRDWAPVIRAMNRVFTSETTVKIAGGAGQNSILEACQNEKANFKTEKLTFMDQEKWDQNMASMDFMIIRGEDSMAQGCLSGIPFIWQAYPQQNDFQAVKVEALLTRMEPHFGTEFIYVKNAWNEMNNYQVSKDNAQLENAVYDFLTNIESLKKGFQSFASSLRSNGNLAENLMTFIEKNIKIEKY
ncbi:MAG: elongation factor P maturation arginine rhamnosyltransferase EarP [Treponema sp.]|nr:elongation factor P maturation arginine rhamnosyltransferase EarP [Treponema sp.]